MGATERTGSRMTREEKRDNILKELYGLNYAERTKTIPIGENTHAALYVKGLIQDLESAMFSLHELLYGEADDEQGRRITDVIRPVSEIVNGYLVDSISENMSFRDFKEI